MIYLKYLSKLMAQIALVVAFLPAVTSCEHEEYGPDIPENKDPEEVRRTVLVYMLASNNGLGGYDTQDLREMCTAAAEGGIAEGRLLVFHSASNGRQVLKEIMPSGEIDTLKVYVGSTAPQTSQRMSEVLDDMAEIAPARDYGLVLWGHGSGWLENGIDEDLQSDTQTYAYGSENGNQWMNITTLAKVLEGRGFGFLHFDCCYMASVEAIYQLRKTAPFIVAYPTEILGWGMPYERTVKYYFEPEPDLESVARETFDFYQHIEDNISLSELNYRPDTYRMCTVSLIRTAGLERLANATRDIYARNSTGIPANYTPQSYTLNANRYYCDFGSYVGALKSDDQQLDEFKAALADVVMLELATEKIWGRLEITEHSGFSTFIMGKDDDMTKLNYSRLDWSKDVASALIK